VRALPHEPTTLVSVMHVEVTTWYLEMLSADCLRRSKRPSDEARVERADIPSPELSRFLYTAVGGPWYWTDRLGWNYARWVEYLDRPAVETLVLYVSGTPAGYVELEVQPDDNVEVAYFGLFPRFIGNGLGGYLLSVGVDHAWMQAGARRVWVHTNSLDGPHALTNYKARGFRVYDEKKAWIELPDDPRGPWPGSGWSQTMSLPVS
jgi:GNAT superfamily N-acetyltransferase